MKKKCVLVTGGTALDTAPIATFLINIKKTNDKMFDKVIVYHNGITKKNQKLMKKIIDVDFIYYHMPYKSHNGVVVNYFSSMIFCKYECLKLLEDYNYVVWSDYDVVINKPLDEILKFNQNIYINATSEPNITLGSKFYINRINNNNFEFDLMKRGICAALIVFSDQIPNFRDIYMWCYEKTREWDNILFCAEEAVFSAMLQKFNLSFTELDMETYAIHPSDSKGDESILHAYGMPKFWNGLENAGWHQNYTEWINMGGCRYSERKKNIYRNIRLLISKVTGVKDWGKE